MNKGFSLIELMIVVAILGILVAVALPQFTSMTQDAKVAKAKEDIATLTKALLTYNSKEPKPATTLRELEGKYMGKIPEDPWGNKYKLDPELGVIYSFGPDGKEGTVDDIEICYLSPLVPVEARFADCGKDNPGFVGISDEVVVTFGRPVGDAVGDPDDTFEFFDANGETIETDITVEYYDGSKSTGPPTFGEGAYFMLDPQDLRRLRIVLGKNPRILPGATFINIKPKVPGTKANNNIVDLSKGEAKGATPAGSPVLIRK